LDVSDACNKSFDSGPEEIIKKAIEVHGGKKNLAKLSSGYAKAMSTTYEGTQTFRQTIEHWWKNPDRARELVRIKNNGQVRSLIQVVAGGRAWRRINGHTTSVTGLALAELQENPYSHVVRQLYPLIENRSFKLMRMPDRKVNGRLAMGIRVKHTGRKVQTLYFDKLNLRLVQVSTEILVKDRENKKAEYVYSDYKDFGGAKVAMKSVMWLDGKRYRVTQIVEMRALSEMQANIFHKP
jgi:hypothetical protein